MIKYLGKQVKNIKGNKEIVAYVFGKKSGSEKIALGVDCKKHVDILKLISCIKRKKISEFLPSDMYIDYLNFEQISNPTKYYSRKYLVQNYNNYAPSVAENARKLTKKLFNVLSYATKTKPKERVLKATEELYNLITCPNGVLPSSKTKEQIEWDLTLALLTADVAQYMFC
jgi:hypothetical protein